MSEQAHRPVFGFDMWRVCDDKSTVDDTHKSSNNTIRLVTDDEPLRNSLDQNHYNWIKKLLLSAFIAISKVDWKNNDACIPLMRGVERLIAFNPEPGASTLSELDTWLARLLILARISMIGFPIVSLFAFWARYQRPWIVVIAVAFAATQGIIDVMAVRRHETLNGGLIIPVGTALSIIAAAIAYYGAGTLGRHQGLDGFLPYLMMSAGMAGSAYGLSTKGLFVTSAVALTWLQLPLGRGAVLWNDGGGFFLWYIVGSLLGTTLRALANQLDEKTLHALELERNAMVANQERWIHDDLIFTLDRVAENKIRDVDRVRAKRILSELRLDYLGDTRESLSLVSEMSDLVVYAQEVGIHLNLIPTIEVDPPRDVAIILISSLKALVGNIAKHAHVPEAEFMIQSNERGLFATLSDEGCGFDPLSVRWSPHTLNLVETARLEGLRIFASSGMHGTSWEFSWSP